MQINKEAIAVTILAMFTAVVIALIILISKEALSDTSNSNNDSNNLAQSPTSSISSFVGNDSVVNKLKNGDGLMKTMSSLSKSKAMFVIGDSSVDCGENSLFYPILRRNLSMFPCSNGSGSTLVHHFLGFEDARGACCGRGWRGAARGCQSMSMACNDSSKNVWWDLYNPTQAVNSLLADSSWSRKTLTDMCRPLSLQALVNTQHH